MDLNQNKRKKVTVFHFMHKFMAKLIHKPLTDRIPPNQPISVEILNFQRRVETTHCRSFQLKMVFASSVKNRLILEIAQTRSWDIPVPGRAVTVRFAENQFDRSINSLVRGGSLD